MTDVPLKPQTEHEIQALAVFEPLVSGLGGMDVLVIGLHDGGFLADALASVGATASAIDSDAARVLAAREASLSRRAQPGVHCKRAPVINHFPLALWREKIEVHSHDAILSYLEVARLGDADAFFSILYRVLRTDGLAAVALPHPCFSVGAADYFGQAEQIADEGWLTPPTFHRSITGYVDAAAKAGFQLRGLSEHPGPSAAPHRAVLLLEFGKDKWAP